MAPRRCRAASASPAVANLTTILRRPAADVADSLASSPSATPLPFRSVTSTPAVAGATNALGGTSRSGCLIGAWAGAPGRDAPDSGLVAAGVHATDTMISVSSADKRRIGNLLEVIPQTPAVSATIIGATRCQQLAAYHNIMNKYG